MQLPTLSNRLNTVLFSLLTVVALSRSEILSASANLSSTQYDFIIVGGGTAGNAIANRLTENPNYQVLVIEAGISQEGNLEIEIPYLCTEDTPNTPYDWNYTTAPQAALNNRPIPYPRGHMLGGSSGVNYMIYTRGSSEDFDRYAKVSGDSGWSWNSVLPYFKKNEKWTPPNDNHNITGEFDPTVHGFNGITSVSLPGSPTSIDGRVINATHELGGDFEFNLDINTGNPLGVGWLQATIDKTKRSSSAASYLAPQFLQRPNLHVAVNTRVSRLIQTSTTPAQVPSFRTVEFLPSSGGALQRLTASKEVILSAGAVNTPLILLNSGIGNSKDLQAVGVKPIVDLPDVGANLADHPFLTNAWAVNSNTTFDSFNQNPSVRNEEISLWKKGTGFLVNTISSQLGFVRLAANDPVFQSGPDPSAGGNSPHYELLITDSIPFSTPPNGNFIAIGMVVVSPASRGTVKLSSSNPFDAPIIDPGFYTSGIDKLVMREAVKGALRFLNASSFTDYIVAPVAGLSDNPTDAEIDQYIVANTGTIWHPVGTASMSPKGAATGVVDPDLRVKKVSGLRVVDASVLPFVPSAHPMAAVYVLAERVSDLIKAAYN